MIFILEHIEVKPGKSQEYLAALKTDYLPPATQRGMRLLGSWQTPPRAGPEEELVFLWGVESWEKWSDIRGEFATDPKIDAWIAKASALRVDGRRRFYVPTPLSPIK